LIPADLAERREPPLESDEPGGSLATMSYLIGIVARCPVMLIS
jgi:hypothetical protein